MKKNTSLLFHCFLLFATLFHGSTKANSDSRKLYIVYMGALSGEQFSPASQHTTMLQEVVGSSSIEDVLVRSYGRSFNGFAAMLSEKEIQQLSSMEEVVSVFPSRTLHLQTTRSWDFIGLNELSPRQKTIESDTIIGVIDTGLWPESKSFSDEGFGPPPKKWKGVCSGGANFTCNNKVIGARFYKGVFGATTARDDIGHGSHTASTAAGNYVSNVNLKGVANGTAKGGVPSARIAAYRVCYRAGCGDADILAAFDDAIADGVDLISISIGSDSGTQFEVDAVAIGSFHAMEKGILTTHSAGNNGPVLGSTSSVAPWHFSIAASTTDRLLVDKIVLGNGVTITGLAINPTAVNKTSLVLDENVVLPDCGLAKITNNFCLSECIDAKKVKGKILLCQGSAVSDSDLGAAGIIYQKNPERNMSTYVEFPRVAVDTPGFNAILSYMNSTKNPQAEILRSEGIKDSTAPVVASFSSRGPNTITRQILKPDISAPGVNILAAYSPTAQDEPNFDYFIISGTSMSCPHAAGSAAYLKSLHPEWSPSAIKSALMTTASIMDPKQTKEAEFAYGSRHINPAKAADPGLVYEIQPIDYIKMLCSDDITDDVLKRISGNQNITCPKDSNQLSWKDLNYPSMAANFISNKQFSVTFNRTVTNVGLANSVYKATVSAAKNVSIKVEPNVLSFKALNEKKSFLVTVSGFLNSLLSSSLVWSDGKHSVRSPIVVYSA